MTRTFWPLASSLSICPISSSTRAMFSLEAETITVCEYHSGVAVTSSRGLTGPATRNMLVIADATADGSA